MRIQIISTLILLFTGCNTVQKETIENIELSSFTEIPEALIGCGCAFSLNEDDFKMNKFIYVDDLGTLSMIKIDNDTVMVDITPKSRSPYSIVFEKDSVLGKSYESEKVIGKLTVRKAGSLIFNETVVGTCGC